MDQSKDLKAILFYEVMSVFIAPVAVILVVTEWMKWDEWHLFQEMVIIFACLTAMLIYIFIGLPMYFVLRNGPGKLSAITYTLIGLLICGFPFLLGGGTNFHVAVLFGGCGAAVAFACSLFLNVALHNWD